MIKIGEFIEKMVDLNKEFLIIKYGRDKLLELTEINLKSNGIRHIDSNTFKGLSRLEILDLSRNEITNLNVNLFESLSSLKELRLYRNKLKRIDGNTFKNLSSLQRLSLSNNEIEEIDTNAFECVSSLRVLRLNGNRLKQIERKYFETFKSIDLVVLYENDNLKALSFVKPSNKFFYDEKNVTKYGFLSDWNEFLKHLEQKLPEGLNDPYFGKLINERFEVVKKLGKGSFGLVYLVDDKKIETR